MTGKRAALIAPFDDALTALGVFAFNEPAEVFHVIPLLLGGLLRPFGVVFL